MRGGARGARRLHQRGHHPAPRQHRHLRRPRPGAELRVRPHQQERLQPGGPPDSRRDRALALRVEPGGQPQRADMGLG